MKRIGIIGGGLAGLYSAIALSKAGVNVTLYEKKKYPFHKVCGEYLSKEVIPLLEKIGVDIMELDPADIKNLDLLNASGKRWQQELTLGAYGISRYELDNFLYKKALECGVDIKQKTEVRDIVRDESGFELHFKNQEKVHVAQVIAGYGKRSRLDKGLSRDFINNRSPYLGVKYHYRNLELPYDTIGMYTFSGGYCGVVKIEKDKFCVSYLIKREHLRREGNIDDLEKNVLSENKELKKIFTQGERVYEKPLVINEISFQKKSLFEDGIFFCGDSTGMITPLCGNGMAMAITGAAFLTEEIAQVIEDKISVSEAVTSYKKKWDEHFSSRLFYGKVLQGVVFNQFVSSAAMRFLSVFPAMGKKLIEKTHG